MSESDAIMPGDIVQLKTGGPKMVADRKKPISAMALRGGVSGLAVAWFVSEFSRSMF